MTQLIEKLKTGQLADFKNGFVAMLHEASVNRVRMYKNNKIKKKKAAKKD